MVLSARVSLSADCDKPGNRSSHQDDRAQVRVLINLYNRCISHALCSLLNQAHHGFEAVAFDEVGADFSPQLVLTDLPVLEQQQTRQWPLAKIIIFDEGLTQQQVDEALCYPNVFGIIKNNCDDQMLLKAIQCVLQDEVWIDGETVKALLQQQRSRDRINAAVHLLNREKQLVELILQGLRNKEIAARVYLSESTVKAYLSRIYRKYQVKNRAQLICKLTQAGIPD